MRAFPAITLLWVFLCSSLIPTRAANPPQPQLLPVSFGVTNGSPHDFGSLRWLVGLTNLLTHGDFEAGSLAGWQLESSADVDWGWTNAVPNGQPLYRSGCAVVARAPGSYFAGPALVQTVTLPRTATSAVLAWDELRLNVGLETTSVSLAYWVEVRDVETGSTFKVTAVPVKRSGTNGWETRSADLSAWIGRRVQLAWVCRFVSQNQDVLALDNIRLETGPIPGLEFDVYLGPEINYAPTNRLAQTSDLSLPLPFLWSGFHQWTVLARMQGLTRATPINRFSVAERSRDLMTFGMTPGPVIAGEALTLQVRRVRWPNAQGTGSELINLWAWGEGARRPGVLLTEVRFSPTNGVELMNVSDAPVNLSGWKLDLYGHASTYTFAFPPGFSLAPGAVATVSSSRTPATVGADFRGAIPELWKPTDRRRAVLLVEPTTNGIVDAVIQGDPTPADLRLTGRYEYEWTGASVTVPDWVKYLTGVAQTLRRVGRVDSNSRQDWQVATGADTDFGLANRELPMPMAAGPGPVAFHLSTTPKTTNGSWLGEITFQQTAGRVVLKAELPNADPPAAWPRFDVQTAPRVEVIAPVEFNESPAIAATTATVRLQAPAATATRVQLTAVPAGRLGVPAEVEIPAGQTEVPVLLTLADDAVFQGLVEVTITPQAEGLEGRSATVRVGDDEKAVLSLELPHPVVEGTSVTGTLFLFSASAYDHWVELACEQPELRVPARVLVPAGSQQVSFTLGYPDDALVGPSEAMGVTARSGPNAATRVVLDTIDNDARPRLGLEFKYDAGTEISPMREGHSYPGVGVISLSGLARNDVAITVRSGDPSVALVAVSTSVADNDTYLSQTTVVVPKNRNSVAFSLKAPDNDLREGRRTVEIVVEAAGWDPAASARLVLDNEVARITVEPVPSPQYRGRSNWERVPWAAWTIDGDLIRIPLRQSLPYSIGLQAADGREIIAPSPQGVIREYNFIQESVPPLLPGDDVPQSEVRMIVEVDGVRGYSPPFNILPALRPTNLLYWVADFVPIPGEKKVLASVRTGEQANRVVEVDFDTQAIRPVFTPPVPLQGSYIGGQLALTPDGKYGLVISGERAEKAYVFRRADGGLEKEFSISGFGTAAAGVPSMDGSWHFVVNPGAAGIQGLHATGSELITNLWIMDFVPPVDYSQLHAVVLTDPAHGSMARLSVRDGALAVEPLGVLIAPGMAWSGRWAATGSGFVNPALRELSATLSEVFPASRQIDGFYDRVAWDPYHRRSIVTGAFVNDLASIGSMWVYGRNRYTPLLAVRGAPSPQDVRRMAVLGPADLAVLSATTLLKIPLPSPLSKASPADLELKLSRGEAGPLEAGREATWNVDVTNHGPGQASDVRVVFETDERLAMVGGETVATNRQHAVQNHLVLPAGASHRYVFRGTPRGNWQIPFTVFTYANEADPVSANDEVSVVETVGGLSAHLDESGLDGTGRLRFWVKSVTPGSYRVEAGPTLLGPWTPVVTNTTPFLHVEAGAAGSAPQFFRAVAQP